MHQSQETDTRFRISPHLPSNQFEALLLDLISIPSVTGNEMGVALVLEDYLKKEFPDASITRQPVASERWNLIMEKGNPQVTLTTHIDVVPGGPTASITPTSIIGRGACDAKGQVVAQLWGLQMALSHGIQGYRCAFVVGEETDAIGARALLELPTTPYLINGEPTENHFVRRSWGAFEIELSTNGTSAHSSLGTADSAIHKLVRELAIIIQNQPDDISINVGTIHGGLAPNIQAPFASCDVCARIRENSDVVRTFLDDALVETTWRAKSKPTDGLALYVPPHEQESAIEVKFASDCSVYASRYQNVMLFGPGSIKDAHTDTESISRVALREGAERIARVLFNLEECDLTYQYRAVRDGIRPVIVAFVIIFAQIWRLPPPECESYLYFFMGAIL